MKRYGLGALTVAFAVAGCGSEGAPSKAKPGEAGSAEYENKKIAEAAGEKATKPMPPPKRDMNGSEIYDPNVPQPGTSAS